MNLADDGCGFRCRCVRFNSLKVNVNKSIEEVAANNGITFQFLIGKCELAKASHKRRPGHRGIAKVSIPYR